MATVTSAPNRGMSAAISPLRLKDDINRGISLCRCHDFVFLPLYCKLPVLLFTHLFYLPQGRLCDVLRFCLLVSDITQKVMNGF